MAWNPNATRMELQPESDAQAAIKPTQLIVHSLAAPWTARRTYEFWRDSSSLESHFGLGYQGDLGQYIGTETRADANADANRRSDGTGAVSVETASNLDHSDPWTAAQIEQLIALGVWMHKRHGVPLRICRSASDPGFGWHGQFKEWSTSGTACPGKARIAQFKALVFPGIVARATSKPAPEQPAPQKPAPTEEASMEIAKLDEANGIDVDLADNVWTTLAFTDAVIHSGPRKLVGPTLVQLTFAQGAQAFVSGRFVLTNPDGSGVSGYGDLGEFPASGVPQFLHNQNVPTGKTLRFQVRARTDDGSTTRLIHRAVSGDYLV
ncbi:N-acetylmuramoyl-L-alanine amidase [Streptomyces sp. NPDC096153]|uniref:peptidoglycan recognition protein family protein n=1 Tax=Streptomyces sp. NPDC096153 TaxID=3155548 RepID=UPI00331F24FE